MGIFNYNHGETVLFRRVKSRDHKKLNINFCANMCVVEKGKLLFLPLLDLRRLDLGLGRRRDADLPGPLHGDLLAVFGRHRLARPEREQIN